MDSSFFGQPQGLSTLFFTEMWERFSYYGMRAILIYYMYYSIKDGGLGFSQANALSIMSIYGSLVYLSSVFGGYLSDRIFGSRKTVFYGGILIMLGHIALSIPMGGITLFMSIVLITFGTGLLKPNVSDMVGDLYSKTDRRRDSGFTIFVFGINLGSLVSPWLVGSLGLQVNFHLGFSLAAVGMFFGLVQYYVEGKKTLSADSMYPSNPLEPSDLKKLFIRCSIGIFGFGLVLGLMFVMGSLNIDNFITLLSIIAILTPIVYFITMLTSSKVNSVEKSRVWAYIPLFIAAVVFWAIEEQGAVVLAMFAGTQTKNDIFLSKGLIISILLVLAVMILIGYVYGNKRVQNKKVFNLSLSIPFIVLVLISLFIGLQSKSIFHINILPSWYQSLNPLFIMIYTPIFAFIWNKLKDSQPSSPSKFVMGMIISGLSYLFMVIPVSLFGTSKVSPFWLIGSWAIIEIAEMLISPIGLSVTTKLAPKAFSSQMMSMWFLADAAAQAINSQIVKYYTGNEVKYFAFVGLFAIVFGLILILFVKPVKRLMKGVN
ncbi:peptide MFS transporter [Apilactobacillus xinyiensis]|uniref:Oligopeptide:H+ symporter n=1 Tax=Apilactobacillus xinyiensis TaxID=2841032 RepID=A0ABT0I2N6_9LACO|nr:oligopeptide:H+ symporter [Apilactobacillus xinyiensis]MCK8624995.1 oligopeptide:H+ symporter [Apilactobacillus xinyiensis]MCL0319109.1 oligopeptide:H+ symporter [Apilactobacillus xinyiensis]MCL0330344.1 oligopeptide:H+ symporter [Apilactobacillus xinyiensis]